MVYVDGFVIPLPKKNVAAYRRLARLGGKVWREHGALEYHEAVADNLVVPDMEGKKTAPFVKMAKLKKGETLVFAWVTYKSKAHRDRVNAKVMKDPRMADMGAGPMPFDVRRMAFGGFKTIVDA